MSSMIHVLFDLLVNSIEGLLMLQKPSALNPMTVIWSF